MKRDGVHRYTFGELIDKGILLVNDGYRAKLEELGGDGPMFLRAGHVTNTHIDFDGVDRFFVELEPKVQNKMSQPGDVVITTKGNSTGRVTYVNENVPRFVYSPHLSFWRSLQPHDLVPGFLRYWSRGPEFQDQLEALACATDMAPYLSLVDQRRLSITLPRPEEQRAIAYVLGNLDDKIELNRRMNETLGAMAQALFKSWFVDVTKNGVPEGWQESTLGEVCEFSYGKALKEEVRQLGSVPVYGSNGQVGWHDEALVKGPGIVVGRKGNPGIVTWAPTDFFPIDTTFYVVPNDKWPSLYFLFFTLRAFDLASLSADSAVPGLNRNIAYMSEVVIPPKHLLEGFDNMARPLFGRIYNNNEESRTLAALRDALLPRMLSGEVRVQEVGEACS